MEGTVLIAEDQALLADGLRKLIESEFPAVAIVENGQALFDAVATLKPAVVLMDIGISLQNGTEVTRTIRTIAPDAKIIILTAHKESEYAVKALRAGAVGYVLKSCTVAELVSAIRLVLSGSSYITPQLLPHVIVPPNRWRSRAPAPLTDRQREVLRLIADGRTAKEIANLLQFSVKTAVFHRMAIMDKLGIRTTAELTRYAMQTGIVASKFISQATHSRTMVRSGYAAPPVSKRQ